MSVCDLEASALGLSTNERILLDREIKAGMDNSEALKSLSKDIEFLKDDIKTTRINARSEEAILKGDIQAIEKESSATKELLADKSKALKEERDVNRRTLKTLDEAKKLLTEQKKELRKFVKDTQNRIVDNYVKDNPDVARRATLQQRISDGKVSLADIYDPVKTTERSIDNIIWRNKTSMATDITEEADAVFKNQDDYFGPEMTAYKKKVFGKLNDLATTLGVKDKFGISDSEKPFSVDYDIVRGMVFGKKKAVDLEGLEEFKSDMISAFGEEQITDAIKLAYKHKSVTPSIDEAFSSTIKSLAEGRVPLLRLEKGTFINDLDFERMVKKYTGKSHLSNLNSFVHRRVVDLSFSESSGGPLTKEDFKLDETITDSARNTYREMQKQKFMSAGGSSAGMYASSKLINNYGKIVVATRPISFLLTSLADRAIGTAISEAQKGSFTLSSLPVALFRGVSDLPSAVKRILLKGDSKVHMNDASKIFEDFAESYQNKLDISDSPASENNIFDRTYGRLYKGIVSHLEAQDKALKVSSVRDYSDYIRKNSNLEFSGLPDAYKKLLKDRFGISTDYEWSRLKEVAKDNEFVTSDKFTGTMATKVAGMEVRAARQASPNDFDIAPLFNRQLREFSPLLHRAVTMFWGFSIRTTMYGFKSAYADGGVFNAGRWAALVMARGFIPSMMVGGALKLASTGSLEETEEYLTSVEGVAESFLGVLARPLQLFSAVIDPSKVAYGVSTPLIRDAWGIARTLKDGGQDIMDGSHEEAVRDVLNQFMRLTIPAWAQTPMRGLLTE